ncbi:MAG: YggS family pyridoxal phosphate-dependent enzyme [Rhodothermales bacterium]
MIDVQVNVRAIADRLEAVQERIAQACQRAGRRTDEITLIGVSKTFPEEIVAAARDAGLRDFGENRVQELNRKAAAIPGTIHGGDVRWHMIGHLQRNKAKDVVAVADVFHALDSLRLAAELDRRAVQAGRVLPCLVQVNVSGEASKFGLMPEAAFDMVNRLAEYEHLLVVGLMTLAAPTDDPEEVRPQFRRLREVFETYDQPAHPHVRMQYLSMGMSGDFEVAIEEGATHIRVGTALFGSRSG